MLVEAVDDEDFVARVLALDVVLEQRVCGAGLYAVVAHRQQSVAFLYNDDVVVLIDDFQARIVEDLPLARGVDVNPVAGAYGEVELRHHGTVEHNLPQAQPVFHRRALAVGAQVQQHGQQGGAGGLFGGLLFGLFGGLRCHSLLVGVADDEVEDVVGLLRSFLRPGLVFEGLDFSVCHRLFLFG